MTTTHEDALWTAGDDWQVNATLLDENGVPYNLAGPITIKWCLINAGGTPVMDEDDVIIVIANAAAGQCQIQIPAAKTSPLPAGKYSDVIRVVASNITSTLASGPIYVTADPWLNPVVVRKAADKPRLVG